MYRYKRFIHFIVFIGIIAFAFNINYNPFIINNVPAGSDLIIKTSKETDALYQKIIAQEEKFNETPKNASIDRVWKKIPGRNGLKLNVNDSYKKMKKSGVYNESLLTFDQIAPDISLKDLEHSPIYKGHPEKNMVALMINVSWGTEHIPPILSILKEQKVKATFFIEGKWAKENAELVKMIDEQGHLIGNHAYNHPNMANLSYEENKKQIEQTNNIINAIIDKNPIWFAPPSGSFTDEVVKIAHHLNMQTVLWTVDTIDWKNPSVPVMINRVMNNIHPGAMILMHPTIPVVKGLNEMILEIKQKDYRIGSVDTLLNEDR